MARLVKPLSDKEIKTAEPREKEYKLSDGKGLFVIVKIDGTKYFRFDFSYGGKRKSTSFGVYPKTTLKKAREKREEARELLSKNINPISVKRIMEKLFLWKILIKKDKSRQRNYWRNINKKY